MERKKLIQADAVAEWIDADRYRVYDLVRKDMIPHVRLGRSVRFDPDAIARWLAAGGSRDAVISRSAGDPNAAA
jgi:excisionase family DNA binding protein